MNFIPNLSDMGIINKNKVKKITVKCGIILLGIFGIFSTPLSKVSASTLDPRDWLNYIVEIGGAYMNQYFSMVHFNVAGNDFGGGLLWLPVEQITGDAVKITIPVDDNGNTDLRFCSSKVRGFYWNSQRGDNRLWPLDSKTHDWLKAVYTDEEKYKHLEFSGGWYTTCSEDETTVELDKSLRDNGENVSIEDLSDIVEQLSIFERDLWESKIDEILDKYDFSNDELKGKVRSAILAGTSFEIDSYGIYGNISHKYYWQQINLVAGAHYDFEKNRITTGALTCSLQRLNNSYPFGYVYDDYGHIGLVGARIDSNYIQGTEEYRNIAKKFHLGLNQLLNSGGNNGSGVCMNDIFGFDGKNMKLKIKEMTCEGKGCVSNGYDIPGWSDAEGSWNVIKQLANFLNAGNGTARTTVFSLGIKGIVGLTDEVKDTQKQYFENNQLQSTLMLRTETSISSIINSVNKNAETICRGKWTNTIGNLDAYGQNVICYNGSDTISATPKQISGKTVVIRGADLILDMSNSNVLGNNDKINLFIDKGNLLLNAAGVNQNNMLEFDEFGYLSPGSEIKAMFLKGNFIINGLILGGIDGTETLNSRLYIHGKVVSYNTITVPTINRKKTVASVIGRGWTHEWIPGGKPFPEGIALTKLFGWSCNAVTGEGSDGTSCKGSTSAGKESQLVDKAFGLIDMEIPGDLVRF